MANDGDEVAMPARLHPQHGKTGFGVVERHPLDYARQDFLGR
jgi:hypothetical protein